MLHLPDPFANPDQTILTRREFFKRTGMGFGLLGLASMLGEQFLGSSAQAAPAGPLPPLFPKDPHFAAKAKHVIHIFAEGGPSHVDTWDPKPALQKYADQPIL